MQQVQRSFPARLLVHAGVACLWLASPLAWSQMGATGVTLSCPPSGGAVTQDLSTQPGVWGMYDQQATTHSNPAWDPAPAPGQWLGGDTATGEGPVPYSVAVDATGLDIDPAATLEYEYRADNWVTRVDWNGDPLAYTGLVSYSGSTFSPPPEPITLNAGPNLLTIFTYNEGDPSGFAARVVLRYNCRAAPGGEARTVPADAPWALLAGAGTLLGALVHARRRRQRR